LTMTYFWPLWEETGVVMGFGWQEFGANPI